MEALSRSVPAYKWLLVLPQLTSRMCHVHSDVQAFMQTLLAVIVDHFPQQALWAMAVVSKSTIRQRQVRDWARCGPWHWAHQRPAMGIDGPARVGTASAMI
jgi:hypothetical protein